MAPDVRIAITQTFPTRFLSEVDTAFLAQSQQLSMVSQILEKLRRLPSVECATDWGEVEDYEVLDYDRGIRIRINEPNPGFWSRAQSVEKRAEAIRQSGGAIHGLGFRISKCGPFWCTHWSCFSLSPSNEIDVSFPHSPPTTYWAGIEARLADILAGYPLRRLNDDELGEEVDWIKSDREPFLSYPDKVTVCHCLFDFV
jgi:hypothetical protein